MIKLKNQLLFLFIFTGLGLYAQKADKGNFGFSFGVENLSVNLKNSPTGTLGIRYLLNEKYMLRGAFKYSNKKTKTKSDTTGNGIDTTLLTKQNSWGIAFGFQRSLGKLKRLDPYAGAELFYGQSDGTFDYSTEVVSPQNPNTFGDFLKLSTADYGKGSFFGVKLIAGFQYYFADHFSFGAEFGYGYGQKTSKNGTTTLSIEGSTFGTPGTTYTTNSARIEESGFQSLSTGTVMISVYF